MQLWIFIKGFWRHLHLKVKGIILILFIDNNFTMPSRTRALLYDEEYDMVVKGISDSMRLMLDNDVKWIVLICGTAHFFLDDVYKCVPEAKEHVIDIIEVLGEELQANFLGRGGDVLIIAAEGTLLKRLYPKRLEKYGITCLNPEKIDYFEEIRYFIEAVKRNQINEETADRFMNFLDGFSIRDVVLGCTEFPILVHYMKEKYKCQSLDKIEKYHFWDPLDVTIKRLKQVMK
ncbi:MAG: aspartate/glutamate racemase family protein [Ruminococcus flavefaciens]|nr:aspartate/glutamate racemase family protein [Ruminococcus flavefaciens]